MPLPARETIAICGVRTWTGAMQSPPNASVIRITDGLIEAIGSDSELAGNARRIDFDGAFAMPGLIDAHVHMGLDPTKGVAGQAAITPEERTAAMDRRAEAMVRSGITTARDLGGGDWAELALRDRIARGEIPGPRLLCAGQPLTSPGGHCHFWGGEAGTPDEVRAVLERQLERGVDWIKVMATGGVATKGSTAREPQFDGETLAGVVAQARSAAREVAAHCHGTRGIANAARAGVRTLEHCSFAGARGFGGDYDAAVVATIRREGAWVSPTVNGGWLRRAEHEGRPSDFFERMSNVLRGLVAAGVPLIASTDAGIPGVHHHALVDGLLALGHYADLRGEALLRAATTESARALGLENETGRLAPGLSADILILPEDPRQNPDTLNNPLSVITQGTPIEEWGQERGRS
jgi:imidazolonepropionase-like amidohydrolase